MRNSVALALTLLVTGLLAESADAQSAFPDPIKWDSSGTVRVLEQNAGALLSGIYRAGGTNNGGATFNSFNDLLFRDPNSIQLIEATVTVLDATAIGGPFSASPRVGLEGFFYWNGAGTGSSTDQSGHVDAGIAILLNPDTQQLEARYQVVRCNDAACNSQTPLAGGFLAPVAFYTPHQLRLGYDGAVFSFQVDADSPVLFIAPDATRLLPTSRFKTLRTRISVPASPTASASVLALFDAVAVNGAPYESFDANTLPRVQILPGSGTFSSRQAFDLVIMVETAGEPLTHVKVFVNGADASDALSLAIQGTLPTGGVTYRFPGVPATLLPVGTPVVLGVDVTTLSGKTARGFVLWKTVTANE